MISGSVDSDLNAVIALRIRGTQSTIEVKATIDTGFCDWLTLPSEMISALCLPLREEGQYLLADGSLTTSRLYTVEVEWFGLWNRVLASEIQAEPLIGIGMLRNCMLNIEVAKGGRVRITPLPA